MRIGVLKGIVETAVGIATLNPALIGKGVWDAGKSVVIGEVIGEILPGTDWADVADTSPFW